MKAQPMCGSCMRDIRWENTESGESIQLDPEPTSHGNVVLRYIEGLLGVRAYMLTPDEQPDPSELRYTTHRETCPEAKRHE